MAGTSTDMQETPHRTLVIRLSSVGDIVLSSLLLRVFHHRFPDARIDYLVKEEFAELVAHSPHVHHTIPFPTDGGLRELKFLRERIKAERYDLVIDIHDSLRSRFLCRGAPHVVRINKRKLARFLLVRTKVDWYRRFGGDPSVARRYLETVRTFGIQDDGQGLELFLPDDAAQKAHDELHAAASNNAFNVIGLCPSAKHGNKMWPADRFAEAALALATTGLETIVLFGSASERDRCTVIEQMIQQRNDRVRIVNCTGRLSLLETAALMDFCSIIITNDSGLMHIAAARKRKVVAIFGPTVRQLGFFPFGTESVVVEDREVSCRPCTHIGLPECPKGHFNCMMNIDVTRVVDAAGRLLRN